MHEYDPYRLVQEISIDVKSISVFIDAVVEYLGVGIKVIYTSEDGWQIDQEIDHYGWEEWQIDNFFELVQELANPRVVLE